MIQAAATTPRPSRTAAGGPVVVGRRQHAPTGALRWAGSGSGTLFAVSWIRALPPGPAYGLVLAALAGQAGR